MTLMIVMKIRQAPPKMSAEFACYDINFTIQSTVNIAKQLY